MSDAADRKQKLTGALMDVLAGAGKKSPEGATHVPWPLVLVDAVLRSEAAGDANRQDELIEAIAILIGLGTDENLTIPEAADRLAGERARTFVISALHAEQEKAEAACREAERECNEGQIGANSGKIEAFAYAIELVNLSALPADNDQVVGELVTAEEARMLADLFQTIPEEIYGALELTDSKLPGFVRRMRKLANTVPEASA